MRIERINENKIKVTVNKEDAKIWNVSAQNLTENTPEAQDLFWFALRQAEKDVDFKVGGAQLLVEATGGSDGFVIYVSKLKSCLEMMKSPKNEEIRQEAEMRRERKRRETPRATVFEFCDFDTLCDCVRQIKDAFFGKSSVYKYKERFYLLLITSDSMTFFEGENVLSEYSKRVPNAAVFEGVLKEHGKELIKDGALEIIDAYFA